MQQKYTSEQYEAFKSFLSQGLTIVSSAVRAGVNVSTAYQWAQGQIPHCIQSEKAQAEKVKRTQLENELEASYSTDYSEEQVKRFFHLRAEGFSVKEAAKLVKVRRWRADSWDKGHAPHFLMEFYNQHRLTEEQKALTPTKAYIMGVLCGDGWMGGRNSNQLALQAVDSEFVARFSAAIFIQYGKSVPIKSQIRHWKNCPAKEVFRCELKSVEIYQDVLSSFGGSKPMAETWRIPEPIFRADEKTRCEFLKGLFDSEASISRCGGQINFGVCNRPGLEDVCRLLTGIGISCHIKTNNSRQKDHYLPLHYIYLSSADRDIFREKIGFTINRKQAILEEFTNA